MKLYYVKIFFFAILRLLRYHVAIRYRSTQKQLRTMTAISILNFARSGLPFRSLKNCWNSFQRNQYFEEIATPFEILTVTAIFLQLVTLNERLCRLLAVFEIFLFIIFMKNNGKCSVTVKLCVRLIFCLKLLLLS